MHFDIITSFRFNKKYPAFLFFLFVFFMQLSIRSFSVDDRAVDLQVIARLAINIFLVIYFVNYIKDFYLYLLEHHRRLIAFFIWLISGSIIFGSLYGLYAIVTLFSCMFIVYVFLRKYGQVVYQWFICSVAIITAIGIFFYYFIPEIGRHSFWLDNYLSLSSRMQGVSGHPNTLGFMICASALLILLTRQKFDLAFFSLIAFLMIGVYLTNSRTALLVLVYFGCFIVSLKYCGWFVYHLLIAILLLSIFFVFSLYPDSGMLAAFTRTGSIEEISSLTGRSEIWQSIFAINFPKNILGYGYGNVSDFLLYDSVNIGFSVAQAHNLWLQIYVASGFVGLLLFAWAFFGYFRSSRNSIFVFVVLGSVVFLGLTEAIVFNAIATPAFIYFCFGIFHASIVFGEGGN